MMPVCTHCHGQVLGGQCLQCGREAAPQRFNEADRIALLTRGPLERAHERHSRPLPMAEYRPVERRR